MRRSLTLLALVASCWASPLIPTDDVTALLAEFDSWAAEHGKVYTTQDAHDNAFEVYVANTAIINELNADPEDNAVYGHTQFSDMTPEQFNAKMLPFAMDADLGKEGGEVYRAPQNLTDVPEAFDWRDHNAVSPVKNQGPCGSCWAESAIQNVESVTYIQSGSNSTDGPTPLSTEQVIECDSHDYACYGGYPSGAFRYMIERGGVATEESYPYTVDGNVICLANQTFNETCGLGMCDDPPLTSYCNVICSDKTHKIAAPVSSWKALPTSEFELANFCATSSPISVALDAAAGFRQWMQFYRHGVASPRKCSTTVLDHAVLIVGYGEDKDPYWTVKNSWGPKWGEDGYFRLVRGKGMCGINTMATTAVV